jgi:hypothetical protein
MILNDFSEMHEATQLSASAAPSANEQIAREQE